MRFAIPAVLCLVFAALSTGPLVAQDLAATASPDDEAVESDGRPLTVVERWQADPAQIFEAGELTLSELRFLARPLVVFADSPNDPQFRQQLSLIEARLDDLVARDVIVLTDTDPDARLPIRSELRPRGFALVLIGKDGRVAQRKPVPLDVREIGRSIDKMPLRQQEIRDGG